MNIFATDPCPIISARNVDDLRINKMHLEAVQMLSTCIRMKIGTVPQLVKGILKSWAFDEFHQYKKPSSFRVLPDEQFVHMDGILKAEIYKNGYEHHPCTRWVQYSRENFLWLIDHTLELIRLHEHLHGKIPRADNYVLSKVLDYFDLIPNDAWPRNELLMFADATDFKHLKDSSIYDKYKAHMNSKWSDEVPSWSYPRTKPEWSMNGHKT